MMSEFTYVGNCVRIEGSDAQRDAKRFINDMKKQGETYVYAESNTNRVVLLYVEDE